jgi:hypothetical protein
VPARDPGVVDPEVDLGAAAEHGDGPRQGVPLAIDLEVRDRGPAPDPPARPGPPSARTGAGGPP